MTRAHPIRRLLARVCSADTMARVVDPTLADMRFEDERPRWRGYAALARAVAMHALLSLPGACVRLYDDDERALPRAVAAWLSTALLLCVPLVAVPAAAALRLSWRAVMFLVPQGLAVALPPSLLIAIPVAYRAAPPTRRLVLRGLGLSLLCAAATLVLIARVIPDANQSFRIEIMKTIAPEPVRLERGPGEMTFHDMRERIAALRLTPGGVAAARRLEYAYHVKLALAAIALPLGLVAVAVSTHSRSRPLLVGVAWMILYVALMFAIDAAVLALMKRFATVPPAVVGWVPVIVMGLVAAIMWRARQRTSGLRA